MLTPAAHISVVPVAVFLLPLLASTHAQSFADAGKGYFIAHAALMTIAWGILIPLGTLIAVYRRFVGAGGTLFKDDPSFYPTHRNLQAAGMLLVVIGFVMALVACQRVYGTANFADPVLWDYQSSKTPGNRHVRIGVVTFFLAILQVTLGVWAHLTKERHDTGDNRDVAWTRPLVPSWLHVVLGFSIVILAYVTMFQGYQIYDLIFQTRTVIAGYVVVGISLFVFIVFYCAEKVKVVRRRSFSTISNNS